MKRTTLKTENTVTYYFFQKLIINCNAEKQEFDISPKHEEMKQEVKMVVSSSFNFAFYRDVSEEFRPSSQIIT